MKWHDARTLILGALLVLFSGANPGCGCNKDKNGNGDGGGDASVLGDGGTDDAAMVLISTDGGCTASGDVCQMGGQCCSGVCDSSGHCGQGMCAQASQTCKVGTDCCTLSCSNGACSTQQCISDGQACTAGGAACCSTKCVGGTCQALNAMCKTAGNACPNGNADCCSKLCTSGLCATPSKVSYCTQPGDICYRDNDCCTGVCAGVTASAPGTCATLGGGCAVDGLACNGCTGCCSSYCAPFGTLGSRICQPASGCHVLGDLCHVNADCCGGDLRTMLPGAGVVVCVPDPTYPTIGTCSKASPTNCPNKQMYPTCQKACQPEGDVCHYLMNGGCSSNSFPADCCGMPGASAGVCKLDKLGVPRCYGITTCVMAGGICASAADCCNGVPCVPDATGLLKCNMPTVTCQPAGAVCTTTTDCCTGYECLVPPGSLKGTCTAPMPPPTPPDMAPPADLNGYTPPDLYGAPPPDLATPPPGMCALYGQSCSTTTPCCDPNTGPCTRSAANGGVPCTDPSFTDCTCYNLIFF
jgi:hypothetical protein